ncbi:MAG: hypothetical protein GY751_22900 [Bacteroidetes bacterium]|nr:hypothetical protein [Bacteroidota bacterium]
MKHRPLEQDDTLVTTGIAITGTTISDGDSSTTTTSSAFDTVIGATIIAAAKIKLFINPSVK